MQLRDLLNEQHEAEVTPQDFQGQDRKGFTASAGFSGGLPPHVRSPAPRGHPVESEEEARGAPAVPAPAWRQV